MILEIYNKLKDYLTGLQIANAEKQKVMSFYKKTDYINSIMEKAIEDTHQKMSFGYGNVNSKICLVVESEETYNFIKPVLQDYFDMFDTNIWDIYITFVDKSAKNYSKKINLLMNEINAVSPQLLYMIGSSDNYYTALAQEMTNYNLQLNMKTIFISTEKLLSSDPEVQKEIKRLFVFLINYMTID